MEQYTNKWRVIVTTLTAALGTVDLITTVVLYLSIWKGNPFEVRQTVWDQIMDHRHDTLDLIVLFTLRLILLPVLCTVAVRLGEQLKDSTDVTPPTAPLYQPLLSQSKGGEGGDNDWVMRHNARACVRRDLVLALCFTLCTAAQVLVGVKCINFVFDSKLQLLQGLTMASQVLWINAEMILIFHIVGKMTAQIGVLRPELHAHLLLFQKGRKCRCDLCHKRTSDTYNCVTCDFDCCLHCFARKDRSKGEGGIRGDKGMREEVEVAPGKYFLRALRLVAPEAPLFLSAFLCLFLASLAGLLIPYFQGAIFDSVIARDSELFLHNIELACGTSFLIGLFGGIRGLCFQVVGRRLSYRVRNQLFQGIIAQDIAFFDSANTGDLTSRLSSDANAMVAPCQTMLSSTLQNLFSLFGGLVFCFLTSWKLSMLAFTTILPITYVTARYAKWSSKLNAEIFAELGQANSVAQEALGNIRTVRAFSTEDSEIEKYTTHTRQALAKGVRDALGAAGAFALNNNLDLGGAMLILWYGGYLVLHADDMHPGFTVGKLITFQLYFNIMQGAYKALTNVVTSFTRAAGAATRVLTLMDSLPDIHTNTGAKVPNPMAADLRLEGVEFFYQMRPDSLVINQVNLHIPAGKTCALVGRSGGGKSTLVHLLLRYYDPSAGRILLDNVDLREWSLRSVHRQLGLVSQETQMFAKTIRENITYGIEEKGEGKEGEEGEAGGVRDEDVIAAAKKASAHEFISGFPDGYDTLIGERGVRLSGGQKQRIAIARAFLRGPRLLLLDEATSALDSESEAQVQAALDILIHNKHRAGGGLAAATPPPPSSGPPPSCSPPSLLDPQGEDCPKEWVGGRGDGGGTSAEECGNGGGASEWRGRGAGGGGEGGAGVGEWEESSHGGATVVLVAHRLSTVVGANIIAVIDQGRVVEQGTHDELLQGAPAGGGSNSSSGDSVQVCGVYARLVSRQLAKQANVLSNEMERQSKPMAASSDCIDKLLDAS